MLLRLASYLAACVCLLGAGVSIQWAWAEFIAIGPRSLMEEAADSSIQLKDRDWLAPYSLITSSLSAKPADASLQYEAGRLAWWQGLHVAGAPEERLDWLAQSVGHLQQSVARRPTWGRAWAELANVYLQQGDYLQSRSALLKAMALEPYEGPTQWMMLWTGFAIWPMLLPDDREQFLRIADNALGNNMYNWVIDPAVEYRREDVLRDLIPSGHPLERHLQSRVKRRDRTQRER